MANKQQLIDALGEAREHLILNKYNDAMMLMAQITIDVIEHMIDEALIVSKGYEEDLKTLKSTGKIPDDTAHNFETLIISGVQAHNGVDIPKEHATKALEVLSNELDNLFKKEDGNIPEISDNLEDKANFNSKNEKGIYEYDEDEDPYPGDFSKDMSSLSPAFLQNGEEDFRMKEKLRAELLSGGKMKRGINKMRLFAIIVPIVLLLLVAFIVKSCFFSKKEPVPIETVPPTTEYIEETEPIETEETTEPMPPEAGYYDVTGDLVKIRDQATTDGSKVKGTVSKGDKVQVKQFYNADWAIVIYEGEEAFIARRYIKKDESLSPIYNETQESNIEE